MNIEELMKRRKKLDQESSKTLSNMDKVIRESTRVANVAQTSKSILDDLDNQFESQTGLDKVDVTFLFFATALQCFRQYFLTDFKVREGHIQGDKKIKDKEEDWFDKFINDKDIQNGSKRYYSPLSDIISKGVPYDASWNSEAFNLGGSEGKGMSGKDHRFRTLGHDPLLGWIFGTSNIMTNTLTDWKFSSYHVKTELRSNGTPFPRIVQNANTKLMLDKVWERTIKEPQILAAAIIKQAFHLKSDEYSKMSLPVPSAMTLSPEFAQQLARFGVDIANIKTVGKQASMATLINIVIAMIHGLFYDESKHHSWKIYEVKTRKILSYSNTIASSSNLIYVAITTGISEDTTKLKKLDIGGLMVTIHRLITDEKFIREVKEEFVFGGFNKMIQGEKYDFE